MIPWISAALERMQAGSGQDLLEEEAARVRGEDFTSERTDPVPQCSPAGWINSGFGQEILSSGKRECRILQRIEFFLDILPLGTHR